MVPLKWAFLFNILLGINTNILAPGRGLFARSLVLKNVLGRVFFGFVNIYGAIMSSQLVTSDFRGFC